MNTHAFRFLLVLPACAGIFAHAADSVWLQCTYLNDNSARLACYDKVAGAQLPPERPVPAPPREAKAIDIERSLTEDQGVVLTADDTGAYTPLSILYDLDQNDPAGTLSIRAHQPIYLLPAWYNSRPNHTPQSPSQAPSNLYGNDTQRTEAKMQVSFKTKIAQDVFKTRADLWFGYTQLSHWQVYNRSWSAPFRGTDYQPELFLTQPVSLNLPAGGKLRMIGGGIVHRSNGQSDPLSRSWNRLYGMAGMEWGKLTVIPRLWWRIPEKSSKDNNPDINRYMGYGDLTVQYRFDKQQTLGTVLRINPKTGKGAVQVDYTFPIAGRLKGYVQMFNGYGENLLDYNHLHRSIGIGLMFNDWDGF
ncbi:MAG: phospholipase A [Neisseria sp.]|nr:phospholipase A [Neisseria sp.]